MLKKYINGGQEDILEQIIQSESGAHYIVIYPDIMTLRWLYSHYIKAQLEDNSDMILLLPYYETTDTVRHILLHNNGASIDVRKYEKQGSLLIVDSVKAYFGSSDSMSSIRNFVKCAQSYRKRGVSAIGDLGAFYHFNKIDKLIKYEMSLPLKHDLKLKGFCCYHQKDFDRLEEQQKQNLLEHHGKDLVIEGDGKF
jgi:hypothetical protein